MRLRDAMERIVRGELAPPPVATLLGISLASFKDGEAIGTLAAGDNHTNPMGTVQGGVLAALADGAMGWAYMTTLGEGESYTTLEMKINFLRPVWKGTLTATARIKKGGKTVGLVECDVADAEGNLAAYAVSAHMTPDSSQLARRGGRAAGRVPAGEFAR